jgi:uncharacterized phage protein (TIGR01671 family)
MREIKFRQWLGNRFSYWGVGVNECTFVSPASGSGINALTTPHMQHTGLEDKNGVEIYEGDVVSSVHFKDKAGRTHHLFHEVQWSENFQGWFLLNCHSRDPNDGSIQLWIAKDKMEVIGNIYENPELLEASK